MKTIILPEAEQELEAAFTYYESQLAGLGVDFVTEYRRTIDRIMEFPHAWQEMGKGFRRCRMKRFPYAVMYRYFETEGLLLINTLVHSARNFQ